MSFRLGTVNGIYLNGLHLVEDGLGELVRGGFTTHVAGADLAVEIVSLLLHYQTGGTGKFDTYPSAMTA